MTLQLLKETLCAAVGTAAFALLFGVDRRRYLPCALTGGIGWLVYGLLSAGGCGVGIAVLAATAAVALLSRIFAVRLAVPATVFLTTGIFPLVPGAGIFWTAYHFVTGNAAQAAAGGFLSIKTAGAIVLGIVLVYQIPNRWFGRLHGEHHKPARHWRH